MTREDVIEVLLATVPFSFDGPDENDVKAVIEKAFDEGVRFATEGKDYGKGKRAEGETL